MVIVSFADGMPPPAQAECVERFAAALDVQTPALSTLRHLAHHEMTLYALCVLRNGHMPDMLRDQYRHHGGLRGVAKGLLELRGMSADPELAARYDALGHLPDDRLGKHLWRHYRDNGFAFPGEKHGFPEAGVYHDFSHVLAGYDTTPEGETLVGGFIAGYRQRRPDHGLFTLLFVLSIFSVGVDVTPIGAGARTGTVGRVAAPLIEAIRRGGAYRWTCPMRGTTGRGSMCRSTMRGAVWAFPPRRRHPAPATRTERLLRPTGCASAAPRSERNRGRRSTARRCRDAGRGRQCGRRARPARRCGRRAGSRRAPPSSRRLRSKLEVRRLEPGGNLIQGDVERRRRIIDARVGDDGDELVQARPGDRPARRALRQSGDAGVGAVVPEGIGAVRVDEQIGVDRDHARVSYASSRIRSHEASRNSGRRPLPLKVHAAEREALPPALAQRQTQSLVQERTQRGLFARRDRPRLGEKGIGNLDRRFHMGTHIRGYGRLAIDRPGRRPTRDGGRPRPREEPRITRVLQTRISGFRGGISSVLNPRDRWNPWLIVDCWRKRGGSQPGAG